MKHSVITIALSFFFLFTSLSAATVAVAQQTSNTPDAISTLESTLRDNPQIQEKIYVHTDNSCYFLGDTLWYKAYVVRSDNLQPTDMSKLLYVELLTPDGYLVERQHVVVSGTGHTCGQFVLSDSLYSGYYEIRAYTRWQLNFNVTEKQYTRDDRLKFYGDQAAKDFFRDFEGLYSRVLPVYQKPKKDGDYVDRYMARRPKQRILKDKHFLLCTFYPEGGQLIKGVPCKVAYELTDNNGQQMDIEGTLSDGRKTRPTHLGRGTFTLTPSDNGTEVTFNLDGKDYTFELPKSQETGLSLSVDIEKGIAGFHAKGVAPAAYAILCRGAVVDFKRLNGENEVSLNASACPTGINEIIVFDAQAQPLASRLFFVNHNDFGKSADITLRAGGETVGRKTTLQPYAPVEVTVKVPVDSLWRGSFSLAVRDAQTDERGYDNGNIMTDMLLSSELKGFIASPAYYFESDDAQHRNDLDLLMMVQGWRRYKRVEKIRYQPEVSLTFEGSVLKIPETASILEIDDLDGVGQPATTVADKMLAEAEAAREEAMNNLSVLSEDQPTDDEVNSISTEPMEEEVEIEWADDTGMKIGGGRVRRSVLVEAEIVKDNDTGGVVVPMDKNGRFSINLPPFYDKAILFVKAYNRNDSVEKNMQSHTGDKHKLDERAFPDYFVKRDMIFPIYTQPYSWYQINSPELLFVDEDEEEDADGIVPSTSRLAGNHTLKTVVVKARRRGKRRIDMTKPAIVRDAYEVYNDLTDYGLMFGVVDFRRMPLAVATYFLGNMGRYNQFNIRALVDGTSFYRNYTPLVNEYDKPATQASVFQKLRLNRMQDVRLFTDYELRTDSGDVEEEHSPDVTIDFKLIPDDGKRYTYRDRRYVLDGVAYPEAFYSPDYSNAVPGVKTDYRRTLYWNPNVKLQEDGTFTTTFYNNSRETRISVSAAGMDTGGQMYYNK